MSRLYWGLILFGITLALAGVAVTLLYDAELGMAIAVAGASTAVLGGTLLSSALLRQSLSRRS